MIDYIFLSETKMFLGLEPKEIEGLLDCLNAGQKEYKKDELIIEEGSCVREFGVLLSGRGRSVKWDASGKLIIITLLQKGSEIGVLLSASQGHESPVSVQATEDVSLLLIPYERLISRCGSACPAHEKVLRNFIGIVAEKGLVLHERIDCLLKPSVREKILNYLFRVSREKQSRTFSISMNRNELSLYLNIERSALSRELSNMKRDGLIDYYKNSFKLTGN